MKPYRFAASLALFSGLTAFFATTTPLAAQTRTAVAALATPALPGAPNSAALPDAPSALYAATSESADEDGPTAPLKSPIARQFDTIVLPGQRAVPLHGGEKVIYGLHDSFNLTQLTGITLSAGWSQLIDSQPHYGRDTTAFAKREGAAALRSTIQTMATDALFSPLFHDDPRYYEMGDGHSFVNRVVYAASRVLVTKSSYSDRQRINAPLLLGYGVAAATNNAYYPDEDRGAKNTAENWGTSLAGAALGFEVSEFLDDALHMFHIRKD